MLRSALEVLERIEKERRDTGFLDVIADIKIEGEVGNWLVSVVVRGKDGFVFSSNSIVKDEFDLIMALADLDTQMIERMRQFLQINYKVNS